MVAICVGEESPATSGRPEVTALQKLNSVIGGWRGIGQPRRGSSRGAWKETADFVWDFSGSAPAIEYQIEDGKLTDSARLTFDVSSATYILTQQLPDGAKRIYRGNWEDDRLVLTAPDEQEDRTYRVTLTLLNEKRTLVLYEVARGTSNVFTRLAEVGYTREGTRLARPGGGQPECIVTGGAGTMQVSYMGETYYAFDDDPAGVIAEAKARLVILFTVSFDTQSGGSTQEGHPLIVRLIVPVSRRSDLPGGDNPFHLQVDDFHAPSRIPSVFDWLAVSELEPDETDNGWTMAAKPDWYYRRSGCNTCKKMDAFLESRGLEAKEVVSAQKARLGPDDALEISRKVQRIVAARGKSVVEIDMKKGEGDEATLLKHLVGKSRFEIEVFFDGDCPLCRREIGMLRRLDRRHKIRFTDIAAADFNPDAIGIDGAVEFDRTPLREHLLLQEWEKPMSHLESTSLDGVHHIAISVEDIASSVDWYRDKFRCEVTYQDDTWAMLQFGNVGLALVLPNQHPPHIGFVTQSALEHGNLKTHRDGTRSVYISDPSGNAVELLDPSSVGDPATTR
ncbi:Uncharacterized protein At5g50100 [Durusdinium trenchii]|uniref:Chloroplastic n=1 Tax=Durusdinium trenchii TaxID=1381693 RepID=A0ABP0HQ60_9DINO